MRRRNRGRSAGRWEQQPLDLRARQQQRLDERVERAERDLLDAERRDREAEGELRAAEGALRQARHDVIANPAGRVAARERVRQFTEDVASLQHRLGAARFAAQQARNEAERARREAAEYANATMIGQRQWTSPSDVA